MHSFNKDLSTAYYVQALCRVLADRHRNEKNSPYLQGAYSIFVGGERSVHEQQQ